MGTWATSNAKIVVYLGSSVVEEFYVPSTLKHGKVWEVFELDSVTRKIKRL